jgi:hypothetical protein
MARYCLLLNCSTGATTASNEGAFDSIAWVSPDGASCPSADTAALELNPGDSVAFAAQVADGSNAPQSTWLQWLTVIVGGRTKSHNEASRKSDNNSPFRLGSRPGTMLLANSAGAGGTNRFQPYDASGNPNTTGPYYGLPYNAVVADIPPGASRPTRSTSKYDAVVVASATDGSGVVWQYSHDPEMDVKNGG